MVKGGSYKKVFPAILLIVVIGIVAYANSFQAPFAMDDNWTIVKNSVIRSLDNFFANPKGYSFLPNRYIATLSLALNYKYGGLDVTGYHIVNLVIHLFSALLVYALLRLTFRTPYFEAQVKSDSGSGLSSTSTSTWSESSEEGSHARNTKKSLASVHPLLTSVGAVEWRRFRRSMQWRNDGFPARGTAATIC